MEPKSSPLESAPGGVPRQPEFQPFDPEHSPEVPSFNPEHGERSPAEHEPVPVPQQPTQQPVPITLPQPVALAPQSVQPATDDNPQVAADEDLIEKEWVDKAKKIIAETRDDPYRREREVGKLQADYLKKRYGKQLGAE